MGWMCTACHPAEVADAGTSCPPEPTCAQNTLVTCGDAGVVETPCGEARCAFDAPVPQCVPATALPCDPGAPAQRCENGRIVDCHPEAGYFLARACGPGLFCAGEDTPRCLAVSEVRCNPDFWSPLCVAGERFECDAPGSLRAVPADCP
jgi:hypothetical protein